MLTRISPFDTFIQKLKFWLIPKPDSGFWVADIFYVLGIGYFQDFLLPSIFRGFLPFDLLTSWIVLNLVVNSLPKSTMIALLACLFLENHSASPSGLYFCCFWVICTFINLIKKQISWRHKNAWIFYNTVSCSLILLMECLVVYAHSSSFEAFTVLSTSFIVMRILGSALLGIASFYYYTTQYGDDTK